jgi:2-polyprenyl-6-methoxyphenol hydroxylase-like FAD-dependent oxidoreductase
LPGVNMIVSDRGARALRQTGIEVANNPQVFAPVGGVVMHGKTSDTAKESLVDSVYMYAVSKADLTKLCRASASSAGVSFRNGCTLTQLQPDINTATFIEAAASTSPGNGIETTGATTRTVVYDMLLGCDGAFSKVQSELIRLGATDLSHTPGRVDFKLIRLPPLHAFPGYRDTWLDCNHVWTQWDGPSMLTPTCVREELEIGDRLPHQGREGVVLLGNASEGDLLGSAGAVRAYFEDIFPDLVAVFRALDKKLGRNQPDAKGIDIVENASPADSFEKFCQETAASPKLTSLSSKTCVPLSAKNIALLGDAGHVMSPSLGQGMNTGLEDIAVLVECLNASQGSAEQALALYDRERSPDVEAVVSMSNRLAKGRIFLRIEFLLAEVLLSNLRKALPTVLKGRTLFADLSDADLRYKEILDDRMAFVWLIRVGLVVASGSAFGASAVAVWQSLG